jgi:chromosome segregation ATPase
MALDPAWIALIGTVFGGAGLKAVETWLGKNRIRVDDAARIRDELRLEITAQREEIKQLETDVDKWRDEYYNLRDKYVELQTELTLALEKIRSYTPPETPPIDSPPKT